MKVAFCVYGYSDRTAPLQPWLTVREVAAGMAARGWEVHMVTDVAEKPRQPGFAHHYVETMRPTNAREMAGVLRSIDADKLVVLSTPMNLATSSWYGAARGDLYAFLSYPFYTQRELGRAIGHLNASDLVTYGRHALVPRFMWARTLRENFAGVIAQSFRTASRVADAAGGGIQRHVIQAGVDLDFWRPASGDDGGADDEGVKFLYVGSAKAIRGFDILLAAFAGIDSGKATLRILARGSGVAEVEALHRKLMSKLGKRVEKVSIEGGWMGREALRDEIRSADVVVLPFVLVPSELPVSVIECVASGTPVITTDIDGLPEAAGKAGMIVRSGDSRGLAKAMGRIIDDTALRKDLSMACAGQRAHMTGWGVVADRWCDVLAR